MNEKSLNCFGCLAGLCFTAVLVWFFVGYFSSRTGLDGTFYRYHTETHTIDENEYVVFKGDKFQWYENGKRIKNFKYDVYDGNRIKVEFGMKTLSFSMSEDKNTVTIDGKEFRKQEIKVFNNQ